MASQSVGWGLQCPQEGLLGSSICDPGSYSDLLGSAGSAVRQSSLLSGVEGAPAPMGKVSVRTDHTWSFWRAKVISFLKPCCPTTTLTEKPEKSEISLCC